MNSLLSFSLLFGAFFLPFKATASILSSILGTKASAAGEGSREEEKTSQNMTLLDASGIFQPVSKASEKTRDINIVDENALSAADLGIGGSEKEADFSEGVSVYVVRKGDTLSQIADMYDVSQNTILWANNMKKGDTIKEGDILLILPVSGVEHTVKKGETIKSIAAKYDVDAGDITWYNNLESDAKLAAGDKLIIPGAELEEEPAKSPTKGGGKKAPSYQGNLKNLSGYYINPVPSARKSRGITGSHFGVDLAAPIGTPIYASASGTVSLARLGYNGGFGNMVIIKHSNGTETLYGHMSRLGTSTGARVSQGEVIGYVGSTGRSTGPHLHFEVKGAKNPGQDWSWAK